MPAPEIIRMKTENCKFYGKINKPSNTGLRKVIQLNWQQASDIIYWTRIKSNCKMKPIKWCHRYDICSTKNHWAVLIAEFNKANIKCINVSHPCHEKIHFLLDFILSS